MTFGHPACLALAAALALGAPAGAARADLMTACQAEIGSYCSDVSEGRGRVTACLVSFADQLGAACAPEVAALERRASSSILVPQDVRNLLVSDNTAAVPQSCAADVERFCSGVSPGEGRVFACLYARSNRVSETCSAEAQGALN